MPNVIRENEIVALGVQRAAGIEERLHVNRAQKGAAVSTGPMENKNGIVYVTVGVAMGRSESLVMDLQARQCFAIAEFVVVVIGIGLNGACIDPDRPPPLPLDP